MTPAPAVLAIDIGGTKMALGLVREDGQILSRCVVATRAEAPGPEGLWQTLAAPVTRLLADPGARVIGAGIGCAGPADLVAGTVSPVNIPAWRDFPIVERLRAQLGDRPVRLAGDAVCAVVGEHWQGAGEGCPDLLGVVVSTGVGGGLIHNGRLVWGASGNAGHLGHMVVELDGEACACGGFGCVETVASGPRMVTWALAQGWSAPVPEPTAAHLAGSARAGDGVAGAAFERSGRALAAGIVSAVAMVDVPDVVIGGGVSRAADLLLPAVRASIERYGRLGFLRGLSVRAARLPETAGLLGAAALLHAPDAYRP